MILDAVFQEVNHTLNADFGTVFISGGNSPDLNGCVRMWQPKTEYKVGDYVYNDAEGYSFGSGTLLQCWQDHTSSEDFKKDLYNYWLGSWIIAQRTFKDMLGRDIVDTYAPVVNESVRGCAVATKSAILLGESATQVIDCTIDQRNIFNPLSVILKPDYTVSKHYEIDPYGAFYTENLLDDYGRVAYDIPLEAGENYGVYIRHDNNNSPSLRLFRDHGTDKQKEIEIEPTINNDYSVYQFTFEDVISSSSFRFDFSSNPATSNILEVCIVKGSIAPHKYLSPKFPLETAEVLQYEGNLIDDTKKHFSSKNIFFGTKNVYTSHTPLPPGTYTLSVKVRNGLGINLYVLEFSGTSTITVLKQVAKSTLTFTLTKPTVCNFKVFHNDYTSVDDLEWAKLEVGSFATGYKPYIAPTVCEFSSIGKSFDEIEVSKDTTLISNTEEVELNCTFKADTKNYIDNKFAELKSLILGV